MDSVQIRKKFLEFFGKRGHKVVSSSSLIPDDPSVLLTTAGMQQFKKYFTSELNAEKDFGSKNVVSIQKCFRTSDIDEVGDESHLTFFEMLGNFSFGGYWKKEAIEYAHEFITKEIGLKIDYVTIFGGEMVENEKLETDTESEEIWKSLGVSEIKKFGRKDNFWGPTGNEGPCGPTSEIYVKNAAGQSIEIWNLVFNEHYSKDGKLTPLKTKGVDTGMGLERLVMVSQGKKNIFETDLFFSLMEKFPTKMGICEKRIVADHIRGIAFLIVDGVKPSNKDQGYILRRLIRRVLVHQKLANRGSFSGADITNFDATNLLALVVDDYLEFYSNLDKKIIWSVFNEEWKKFLKTVNTGLRELKNLATVDSKMAFKLYESYGLPYEVIKEISGKKAEKLTRKDFEEEFKKHQEISRAGAEKKFGGHGLILNTGELKAANEEELKKVTRLHTATHLLQRALREVLGNKVEQRGSDITAERTRFDFSFSRKMIAEEIKRVEDLVNEIVKKDLPVNFKEMPIDEAKKTGALYFFKEKYPKIVKVYFTGDSLENAWSKEFCGGPHVERTAEIGEFKILKEEAVASEVRRIRAKVI